MALRGGDVGAAGGAGVAVDRGAGAADPVYDAYIEGLGGDPDGALR